MTLNDLYNCFKSKGASGDTPVEFELPGYRVLYSIFSSNLEVIETQTGKVCVLKNFPVSDT